jgi:hypothetical protein
MTSICGFDPILSIATNRLATGEELWFVFLQAFMPAAPPIDEKHLAADCFLIKSFPDN